MYALNQDLFSEAYPSRVEIDCAALAGNIRLIRSLLDDDVSLMAVVKANAYGHGAPAVADIALRSGADLLAVAHIGEAAELRGAGIAAPILAMSSVAPALIPLAIELHVAVTAYSHEQVQRYAFAAKREVQKLIVHVKVDTGMGRLGVQPNRACALCQQVTASSSLELAGIYTHFSAADDDPPHTAAQLSRFKQVLADLRRNKIRFQFIHAANSAALLTSRDSQFNVVRPGLLLYGLSPVASVDTPAGLRPALTWKTHIAQVKTLPPGSSVGYGNTYRTQGRETIAVLPVGYGDGLRRSPRTWRDVLVRGIRAPLVGRVSMEKVTINVSHIPDARPGDEVVLLGIQGHDEISADEIARWLGTINYEVVTAIAPRAPRIYLRLPDAGIGQADSSLRRSAAMVDGGRPN